VCNKQKGGARKRCFTEPGNRLARSTRRESPNPPGYTLTDEKGGVGIGSAGTIGGQTVDLNVVPYPRQGGRPKAASGKVSECRISSSAKT